MTTLAAIRVVHLVAAATWVGGLVVMGPLVVALRRAGATRDQLRAAARMFAVVSWIAMGVAILTGLVQVEWMGFPWTYPPLHVKIGAVLLACVLALAHQLTARRLGDRVRGLFQIAILGVSLGIVVAAVAL